MLTLLVIVFVCAYAAIALEHPIGISKSASALVGAGLLWTIYAVAGGETHEVGEQLGDRPHHRDCQCRRRQCPLGRCVHGQV